MRRAEYILWFISILLLTVFIFMVTWDLNPIKLRMDINKLKANFELLKGNQNIKMRLDSKTEYPVEK